MERADLYDNWQASGNDYWKRKYETQLRRDTLQAKEAYRDARRYHPDNADLIEKCRQHENDLVNEWYRNLD